MMKKNSFEKISPVEDRNFASIKKEILDMSPRQLVDYLQDLEENGELKKFLEKALDDSELLAQISYWEKWLQKEQIKLVEKIIKRKKDLYPGEKEGLPLNLEKKFNEQELELIFKNMGAIQLTFGCSKGCPFCGFDALPGVREYLSYSQIANVIEKYGKNFPEGFLFYYASEPSDYKFEDKTFKHVQQLFFHYTGKKTHVTTNETKDLEWLKFIEKNAKDPRVSLYSKSSSRFDLEEIKKLGIFSIGEKREHLKGIGKSIEEDSSLVGRRGIGCSQGILMTPRGMYNVIQVPISNKFPQGQIIQPIEKISKKDVSIGDDLFEVMRENVVEYSHVFFGKDFLKPVSIKINGESYYLAWNDNYKITQVESSEYFEEFFNWREEYISCRLEETKLKEKKDKGELSDSEYWDLTGPIYVRDNELSKKIRNFKKKNQNFFRHSALH